MKIGIISDIHGNSHALEMVVKNASSQGVEKYIILGDLFAHGPCPREVLNILIDLPILSLIMGNHDFYVASQLIHSETSLIMGKPVNDPSLKSLIEVEKWWLAKVGSVGLNFLASAKQNETLTLGSQNILCCHASPWSYELAPSQDNSEFIFEIEEKIDPKIDVFLSGHTHVSHFTRGNRVRFINPGSVGLPIDGNNQASYSILTCNSSSFDILFLRVEYDIDKAIFEINKRQVPLGTRTIRVLQTGLSQVNR